MPDFSSTLISCFYLKMANFIGESNQPITKIGCLTIDMEQFIFIDGEIGRRFIDVFAKKAAEGVRAIRSDYAAHSRAAREIAEEHFDSDKVLTRLLEKLEVPS